MARELSFSKSSRSVNIKLPKAGRSVLLMLIVTFFLNLFVFRLIQLQILEGQYNRTRAEENRIRPVGMIAERGNILDRKGKLLAANRLTRSVYLWPKEQKPEDWKITAHRLSQVLNIPTSEILQKLEKIGYNSALPVRISRDINPQAFTVIAEKTQEFKGIEIREESSRYYPNGNVGAHVLGYIGEATTEDLAKHPEYPMGMIVGQMGIERKVNDKLAGVWGNRLIEVDAKGKEIRELGTIEPKPGQPVRLTLDAELQKTAEKALNGRRGGIAVIDIKTGAVLALASGPTFDPNLFTRKITPKEWDSLQAQDKPFLNRALEGYPPGSTFKIVTSVAGMESGKFSPDSILVSSESIMVGGVSFHEHGSGYGPIGFTDALAYSSNTFFYQMGMAVGPEQIAKWARLMGIGETTNLDLLGLGQGNHGSVPTPAEKQTLYGEEWYAGDTVTMAIGQGVVLTTPLEMAVMVATIANGGYRVKPHLLASQTNTPATKPEATGMKPGTVEAVRKGLIAVVEKGTGQSLKDGSIPLTAGKTGTAEVLGQQDNSNYIAYGPANDPQIAIGIVVENGGYGATAAAPIAQEIFKTYFKK
ncbi:MAG TPA: penicillin-binding protein 2 [Halomicronema sp.]